MAKCPKQLGMDKLKAQAAELLKKKQEEIGERLRNLSLHDAFPGANPAFQQQTGVCTSSARTPPAKPAAGSQSSRGILAEDGYVMVECEQRLLSPHEQQARAAKKARQKQNKRDQQVAKDILAAGKVNKMKVEPPAGGKEKVPCLVEPFNIWNHEARKRTLDQAEKEEGNTAKEEKKKVPYLVSCKNVTSGCSTPKMRWMTMKSEKISDDHGNRFEHTCASCLAKEKGCTENQALADIKEGQAGISNKRQRHHDYNATKKNVRELFHGMTNCKQLHAITLVSMTELMTPFAEFIIKKARQLEKLESEVLEHKWLAMQLRDATDPNKVVELVAAMEKLDYDVPCLAFTSKGKLQNKFIRAATYSDEWTVLKDKRGNEIGAVRSWYVCCSGGASNQCNTLILSKDWERMKQDPLATGQRWYCKVCFARYAHKFGQVVEVSYKDQVFYFWALPPDIVVEDIRAMSYEATMEFNSSIDLYEAAIMAKPMTGEIIKKHKYVGGVYKLMVPVSDLPKLDWYQIFNMVGVVPLKNKGAARER